MCLCFHRARMEHYCSLKRQFRPINLKIYVLNLHYGSPLRANISIEASDRFIKFFQHSDSKVLVVFTHFQYGDYIYRTQIIAFKIRNVNFALNHLLSVLYIFIAEKCGCGLKFRFWCNPQIFKRKLWMEGAFSNFKSAFILCSAKDKSVHPSWT